MNKQGRFVVEPLQPIFSGITPWRRRGTTWERGTQGDVDSAIKSFFTSILAQKYESQGSDTIIGSWNVRTFGQPTPVPPPVNITWPSVKSNNKPFKRAVNNGSIVVAPYQVGITTLTFKNGGSRSNVFPPEQANINVEAAYFSHGRGKVQWITNNTQALVISDNLACTGTFSWMQQFYSTDDLRTVFDNNYRIPTDGYFNQVPLSVESDLIVGVASDANRSAVDILTALAELPETVSYVMNLIKSIIRAIQALRKKELRLNNKLKQVRLTYDEVMFQLSQLDNIIQKSGLSKRAKRKRLLDIKRKQKNAKRQFYQDVQDVTSAISDLWLQYRYAIMPNVYLIQDALKAYESKDSIFKRWMSTKSTSFIIENFEGEIASRHRAFIKRKFVQPSIGNLLSANIFLTAWELIPLSFVIDWVINIGDSLSALYSSSLSSGIEQEGSTYSWKIAGSAVRSFADGSSVTITLKGYSRVVIQPDAYCGIQFNPDLSPVRLYDSLALSWNIALKKLLSLRNK